MKKGLLKMTTLLIAGVLCFGSIGVKPAIADTSTDEGTIETTITEGTGEILDLLPSVEVLQKELGCNAKVISEFKNGYKFDFGEYFSRSYEDKNKIVIEKDRGIDVHYKKGDNSIMLSMVKVPKGFPEISDEIDIEDFSQEGLKVEKYKGAVIFSAINKVKCVSEDYVPTEEEQKLIDDGVLSIFPEGNGEEHTILMAMWQKDGVEYDLNALDNEELTVEDCIELAKEVIDK